MYISRLLAVIVVFTFSVPTYAAVPGSIDVTCDADRTSFRNAARLLPGGSSVTFHLYPSPTGGSEIGAPGYDVLLSDLMVFKAFTEKFDSVNKRKAVRIDARIGNDASPVSLPPDGIAWMELEVGSTTLGCDFAATGTLQARRRLHSVPFGQLSGGNDGPSSRFGGDGSDGPLTVSSGTTTLDAAGARLLVKNYTTISITNTAKLTLGNEHPNGTILILKSQGDVTIASVAPAIDLKGKGSEGGAHGVGTSEGQNGKNGVGNIVTAGGGGGSPSQGTPDPGVGGVGPQLDIAVVGYGIPVSPGAGGGGAGRQGSLQDTPGDGGRGGGAVLIECAGFLGFTGAIDVSASDGGSAANDGSGPQGAGGGGGGGGGVAVLLYDILTANTGSIATQGGGGGSGSPGSGTASGGGGGGAGLASNGLAGQLGTTTGGTGGAGGSGAGVVTQR